MTPPQRCGTGQGVNFRVIQSGLQRDVNYSTFGAARRRRAARNPCYVWLQCIPMRIELPSTSWADTQRAEEDAHTLTVAAQAATDLLAGAWRADAGEPLRTQVDDAEPVIVTITF